MAGPTVASEGLVCALTVATRILIAHELSHGPTSQVLFLSPLPEEALESCQCGVEPGFELRTVRF